MVSAVLPTAVGPVITINVLCTILQCTMYYSTYYLADNAAFRVFNKRTDILHLFRVWVLGTSFGNAVLQHALRIDNAIGIVNGLDSLVGESPAAQSDEINTCISHRLFACNDVGRNILTGACTTLEHDVSAYVEELVEQAGGRDDGAVVDDNLSGKFCRVTDDTTVAYHAVVSDVHILHQQIAVTYDGLALRCSTSTDGDIFANGVVVANLTGCLFALELQVLWLCRDAGTRKDLVIVTQTRSEVERDVIQQLVVVANDDILVNYAERTDDIAVSQLCLRIDNG